MHHKRNSLSKTLTYQFHCWSPWCVSLCLVSENAIAHCLDCLVEVSNNLTILCSFGQEYKRKQLEEQRQSERLQRQLQQEHAYLVSLQQQQQEKKPQLYHYNKNLEPNNKPTWAREVAALPHYLN